jgi:hypothetical protein
MYKLSFSSIIGFSVEKTLSTLLVVDTAYDDSDSCAHAGYESFIFLTMGGRLVSLFRS